MIFDSVFFTNKNILITGGAGSIGSELVKKLLHTDVRTIRVLDNNETGLHDLQLECNDDRIRLLLGDITNPKRLVRAMEDVDIVFHTAALKHVPICEYNPFEAAEVNVIGTQNCIDAAIVNKVEKMIFISTDKAVSPYSVMGATKLVAERLTIAANRYSTSTRFACVRFGNVLNSRGSVLQIFKKQILSGSPVTLTEPEMSRFFMTIPQAVDLILKCSTKSEKGEIFVLKMPAIKIQELANAMIEYCNEVYSTKKDIEIIKIGIRPGEKMFEELIIDDEKGKLEDKDDYFIIKDGISHNEFKSLNFSYSSNDIEFLSKDEIKKILYEINL